MTRRQIQLFLNDFFLFFGQLAALFWESLVWLVRGAVSYRHTVHHMASIGVGSLLVALITVGFSGAVTGLYVAVQLVKYGQERFSGGLIGKSLALEIAPVITAIVVAARSGSSMAAELGSMKVTEQIDALRALGTSPVKYLVLPRLLATLIMLPLVTALANGAGIIGGYLATTSNGIAHIVFIRSLQEMTTVGDQITGIIKTIPFAILIALIGCRQGLTTTGGAQGVGRATTSAVVFSMIAIYVVDYFLSVVLQDNVVLY